jgi:hypothetical protein
MTTLRPLTESEKEARAQAENVEKKSLPTYRWAIKAKDGRFFCIDEHRSTSIWKYLAYTPSEEEWVRISAEKGISCVEVEIREVIKP